MGRRPRTGVRALALSAVLAIVMLAGVAHAKPRAKAAPPPLPSDSSYAAMSARPVDSLSASELMWLAVQRDIRRRRAERPHASNGISEPWQPDSQQLANGSFGEMAARPYEALSDSDRVWLFRQGMMQPAERPARASLGGSEVVGVILISAIVGLLAAGLAIQQIFRSFP